jgi:hypothetical protein
VIRVGPADRIIHFKGVVHCMTRAVPKGFLPKGWMGVQLEEQRKRYRFQRGAKVERVAPQ